MDVAKSDIEVKDVDPDEDEELFRHSHDWRRHQKPEEHKGLMVSVPEGEVNASEFHIETKMTKEGTGSDDHEGNRVQHKRGPLIQRRTQSPKKHLPLAKKTICSTGLHFVCLLPCSVSR